MKRKQLTRKDGPPTKKKPEFNPLEGHGFVTRPSTPTASSGDVTPHVKVDEKMTVNSKNKNDIGFDFDSPPSIPKAPSNDEQKKKVDPKEVDLFEFGSPEKNNAHENFDFAVPSIPKAPSNDAQKKVDPKELGWFAHFRAAPNRGLAVPSIPKAPSNDAQKKKVDPKELGWFAHFRAGPDRGLAAPSILKAPSDDAQKKKVDPKKHAVDPEETGMFGDFDFAISSDYDLDDPSDDEDNFLHSDDEEAIPEGEPKKVLKPKKKKSEVAASSDVDIVEPSSCNCCVCAVPLITGKRSFVPGSQDDWICASDYDFLRVRSAFVTSGVAKLKELFEESNTMHAARTLFNTWLGSEEGVEAIPGGKPKKVRKSEKKKSEAAASSDVADQ